MRFRTSFLVVLLVGVALAGCTNGGTDTTTTTTTPATTGTTTTTTTTTTPPVQQSREPAVLEYVALQSGTGANTTYAFTGPTDAAAGWTLVRLRNNGTEAHQAVFVKLPAGSTVEDYLAQHNATNGTHSAAGHDAPTFGGGVGVVSPAAPPQAPQHNTTGEAYVFLEPGTYAVVCEIPGPVGPHMLHGMIVGLNVTASNATAREPTADLTLTLVDFGFNWSANLTAGRHVVKVVNNGTMPHEAVMFHLAPGNNATTALAWFAAPQGPPPFGGSMGAGAISPGEVEYVVLDVQRGGYAVVCFLPDENGAPHFTRGMVQDLTVA